MLKDDSARILHTDHPMLEPKEASHVVEDAKAETF